MIPSALSVLGLTCSLLAAQSAGPRTAQAVFSGAQSAPAPALLFDQPGDGSLWVAGTTYKAGCDGETFTYAPFLGSHAPRTFPLRLRLSRAEVAGASLPLAAGVPARQQHRVTVDRGTLTEVYDFAAAAVEQSFLLTDLPARGELVLTLEVDSELRGEPASDGIAFANAFGAVSYAHAVAFDAAGARQALAIGWNDGRITLTVPAEFVATSRLPLVVDPVLTTVTIAPTTYHEETPALAYNRSTSDYVLVWQRVYSATDRDVFAQRLDADLTPVGTRITIDTTLDSWDRPRIATGQALARALVVAQVTPAAGALPSWIGGRMLQTDAGTADPTLVIDRQGTTGHHDGNKFAPDVGSDTANTQPNFFTVVWSREAGPGNRDIHLKQVTIYGALRGATATVVEATADDEHSPAISPANGYWVAAQQRWALAWVRTVVRAGVPDGDVRAALVNKDGQVTTLANGSPIALDTSSSDDAAPAVSSLMDANVANFLYLCTFTRRVSTTDRDVIGIVFDGTGAVRAVQNLSQLEGAAAGVDQWSPSVDTDTTRFVVATTQGPAGASRTFASLLAWNGATNQLVAQHARVPLSATATQQDARVFARSSSGPQHTHYAVAHTLLPAGGKRHVEVALFDGVLPGGYAIRPTACGGLTVSPQGTPAIGHSMSFVMNRGSAGLLLGTPANIPLPCAACVLGVANPVILAQTSILIPPNHRLVGGVVAVQGFHVGSGTCLASIAFADTVDVTIQ